MPLLTFETLKKLYPRAANDVLEAFSDQCDELFEDYGIGKSETRLAYFLAQLGHESGGLSILEENLNYSADRLTRVWATRFRTIASAKPYAKNPKALANKVYANRMGNGNEQSGDGYRYRGRGFIQITGRANYSIIGQLTGLDLIGDPDLAADPMHSLKVACGFWEYRHLNRYADNKDFVGLTKSINGGINGLEDRRSWLEKVLRIVRDEVRIDAAADADRLQSPDLGTAVNEGPRRDETTALQLGSRGEQVGALQQALKNLGYQVGAVDGVFGSLTAREVMSFQLQNNLATTGQVDLVFWEALKVAKPNSLARERTVITPEKLREIGSQTVTDGDRTKKLGWVASILGALGIGNSAVVSMANSSAAPGGSAAPISPESARLFEDVVKLLPPDLISSNEVLRKLVETLHTTMLTGKPKLSTMFDLLPSFFTDGVMNTGASGLAAIASSVLPGFGGSLLTMALGLGANYLGNRIVNKRTADHQTGANTGR